MRGRGETILVVEDQLATQEALVSCLEELNYQVLTAANGRDALAVYRQARDEVALVLTDMVMPEMGRRVLSQQLRQLSPDVKVVVVSGYPLDNETKNMQSPDFVGWLRKLVALDRLAQVVAQVLASDQ